MSSKVTKKQLKERIETLEERIETLEEYTGEIHKRQAAILRYFRREGVNIHLTSNEF